MKEQILIFFSNINNAGLILDYTKGGEVDIDISEGCCMGTDDLLLSPPDVENRYGLWLWEGSIGVNSGDPSDIIYMGDWRRLSPEEIVLLVKGLRVVSEEPQLNDSLGVN